MTSSFSYFENGITQTKPSTSFNIEDIPGLLASGLCKEKTDEIRAIEDPNPENKKKKQDEIKIKMPYVTFSGTFKKRGIKSLEEHSGLIVLDIDNLGGRALIDVKIDINRLPYTLLSYISPRGGGMKVVFKIPAEAENQRKYFDSIAAYFLNKLKLELDQSGKDVSRACFLCYDPDPYYNPKAEVWDKMPSETYIEKPKPNESLEYLENEQEKYEWCLNVYNKRNNFPGDGRHKYIYGLAGFLNSAGVSQIYTRMRFREFIESDFDETEIFNEISHVYDSSAAEFNTYRIKIASPPGSTAISGGVVNGSFGKAYIIENPSFGGRFHLAYKNEKDDRLVQLDKTPNEFGVIIELIKKDYDQFELRKENISFINDDGKECFHNANLVKCNHRTVPEKMEIMLGAPEISKFYDKKADSMLVANHKLIDRKPVFHQDIHDFIDQLPFKTEWMQQYLSIVHDMEVAVPWIHCFGKSKSGKSYLALLLGSLWSNVDPDKDFFKVESFQDNTGSSPVIWIEEDMPNKINLIKEMITSYKNSVNKKNRAAVHIVGYPRFVSSINSSDVNFPINKIDDIDALFRRVQVGYFEEKHTEYLKPISMEQTKSWIDGRFGEYVAWCRENIVAVGNDGDDVLALKVYETEHFTQKGLNIDPYNMRIIEEVINLINGQDEDDHTDKTLNKPYLGMDEDERIFLFSIGASFTDVLIEKRIIKTRKSSKELKKLLERAFGEIHGGKDSHDRRYQSLSFDGYERVCEELDIEPLKLKKEDRKPEPEPEEIPNGDIPF